MEKKQHYSVVIWPAQNYQQLLHFTGLPQRLGYENIWLLHYSNVDTKLYVSKPKYLPATLQEHSVLSGSNPSLITTSMFIPTSHFIQKQRVQSSFVTYPRHSLMNYSGSTTIFIQSSIIAFLFFDVFIICCRKIRGKDTR